MQRLLEARRSEGRRASDGWPCPSEVDAEAVVDTEEGTQVTEAGDEEAGCGSRCGIREFSSQARGAFK